jgi:creatinine amidohydrolase
MRRTLAGFGLAAILTTVPAAQGSKKPAGIALSDLSWVEAEPVLTSSAIVVIPLGVATVQHGPHLKLNNNERLARYLAGRVQTAAQVVVAPVMTYHYSPTFAEYPGSTSLSERTATDMTIQIVRSLARYGPRRFYVLNVGGSTSDPLRAAAFALANEGILLTSTYSYAQNTSALAASARIKSEQTALAVAHADEIETSMMLYVDPAAVDMKKAVAEYGSGSGPMTRQKALPGVFSASGILGDPTLATREKGAALVETLLTRILGEIEDLRNMMLPQARPAAPAAPRPAPATPSVRRETPMPNGCTPDSDRAIREIGARFSVYWRQMDAELIASLFAGGGDIRHPDGTIERGQQIIRQNRQELFSHREYRGSVHPVYLNDVRCLGPNTAIADGKWELRLADFTGSGRPAGSPPRYNGWCTLVLSGTGGSWAIEAWRYTIDPPNGTPPPTTLKQPGFIGR